MRLPHKMLGKERHTRRKGIKQEASATSLQTGRDCAHSRGWHDSCSEPKHALLQLQHLLLCKATVGMLAYQLLCKGK